MLLWVLESFKRSGGQEEKFWLFLVEENGTSPQRSQTKKRIFLRVSWKKRSLGLDSIGDVI